MTVARFEGTDPVARYWLANCEGFAVEGAARGVVEELLRDGDPHVTARLVVRTRGGRRTIVQADAVATVVPGERTLVVERTPRRPRRKLPIRSAAAGATARLETGARRVARTVAAAGPPVRVAGRAAGRSAAHLAEPAAAVVAYSLGLFAGELRATGGLVLRSARRPWTIVRPWR